MLGFPPPTSKPQPPAQESATGATEPVIGRATSTSVQRHSHVQDSSASPSTTETAAQATATTPATLSGAMNPSDPDISQAEREREKQSVRLKNDDIFQVNTNCGELVSDFGNYSDDFDVAGSLCRPSSVAFFKQMGASPYIIKSLSEGHHSKLKGQVPRYEKRNNNSFYEHEEFAVGEIKKLIAKGRVVIVKEQPFIVNPLSVAVQRTKLRLILDCSYLNGFVEVPKFKYEDVRDGINYFKRDCFMFKWDLRDGYHQIAIHPEFQKYLGFKLNIDGKPTFCQYVVSPFGLRDMPYLFTKIFRVLVRHWRSIGLATIKFLDDGICFCESEEDARQASMHIRSDLFKAGGFWSVKKSQWVPAKSIEWLGVMWDSNDRSIAAAPHRITKIKETTSQLLSLDSCKVKTLASFTGQVISLLEIVGNCCRLTTRCSQIAIASAPHWDASVSLSPQIKEEVKFWLEHIEKLNKKSFLEEKAPMTLNVIASDASDSGCGSLLNHVDMKAARLFSDEEKDVHSTHRELLAVVHALESFLPQISHSKVKILIDNQSAARILEVGSMKVELHKIAMEVFFLCLYNGITLETQWIPREDNEAADAASRVAAMVDTDDWQITIPFFEMLNRLWGPVTIDCFANYYNSKHPRFYSLFNSKGSEGVDAFTFNWAGEICLLVPPVCIVGRVLSHMRLCRAKGILVVPNWPSALFWPMLKGAFSIYIRDFRVLKGSKVLTHGMNTNSLLGSPQFKGEVLALLLDCS